MNFQILEKALLHARIFWAQWGRGSVVLMAGYGLLLVVVLCRLMASGFALHSLQGQWDDLNRTLQDKQPMQSQEQSVLAGFASFYSHLGKVQNIDQDLNTIFSLAVEHGVSLDHGDYHWSIDPASKTTRYQITFPVKTAYPQVRDFTEAVKRSIPYAALDAVDFKRASIADAQVEATIKWTLYMAMPEPGSKP